MLRCYITLEKDKDVKKKRNDQTPPTTPSINFTQNPLTSTERLRLDSTSSAGNSDYFFDQSANICMNTPNTPNTQNLSTSASNAQISSSGAKKVNVEVIMRSNPFRVGKCE